MDISPVCKPPAQPSIKDADREHSRFNDYQRYRSAMSRQMVTGLSFARWLEQTEQAEQGFSTVYEVSAVAKLAPGWYKNEFGPGNALRRRYGPFDTKQQAADA